MEFTVPFGLERIEVYESIGTLARSGDGDTDGLNAREGNDHRKSYRLMNCLAPAVALELDRRRRPVPAAAKQRM